MTANKILQQQTQAVNILWNCYRTKRYRRQKSTIWENTYGCAEQYRCATTLYLLLMLSREYNIVNDHGVGLPGYEKYVVDDFNATLKCFFTTLMTTVQLPGTDTNNSNMVMHTAISNTDISIARELKNIFQTQHVHMF